MKSEAILEPSRVHGDSPLGLLSSFQAAVGAEVFYQEEGEEGRNVVVLLQQPAVLACLAQDLAILCEHAHGGCWL